MIICLNWFEMYVDQGEHIFKHRVYKHCRIVMYSVVMWMHKSIVYTIAVYDVVMKIEDTILPPPQSPVSILFGAFLSQSYIIAIFEWD